MPNISDSATRRLSIYEMSGGVNFRDGVSKIKDNQLSDCLNLEYKAGILQTRQGFTVFNDKAPLVNLDNYQNTTDIKVYSKRDWCVVINGYMYCLFVIKDVNGLNFKFFNANTIIDAVTIPSSVLPQVEHNCNIFLQNDDVYCFCSGYHDKPENHTGDWTPFYIFKVYLEDDSWKYQRITNDDLYVPTLYTGGQAADPKYKALDEAYYSGDAFETYNLLGDRCKIVCSTVNAKRLGRAQTSDVDISKKNHFMEYAVLIPGYKSSEENDQAFFANLKIVITNSKGKQITHTATEFDTANGVWKEASTNTDNLTIYKAWFEGNWLCFWFRDKNNADVNVYLKDEIRNNMEIIFSSPLTNSQKKSNIRKVMNMTFSEWFGGSAEGIYGGIHLFMGGNIQSKEKSLVCWSDFNKPLYFPESGYAYVGDKSQKVTAFGKQSDNLIIFKQREIYSTKYSSGNSAISAESLEEQSIIEVTSAEVTFPMSQVHGYIGCNCPDTVQLCRNRLCWAQNDGKIYTLVSNTQYNERSIFEVSGMVEGKIKSGISNAMSADYDGKYILVIGENLYVMDYNSYGYASVSHYSKTEDSQENIPWWVWKLPKYPLFSNTGSAKTTTNESISAASVVSIFGKLFVFAEIQTKKGSLTYKIPELFVLKGENDVVPEVKFEDKNDGSGEIRSRTASQQSIESMATTKFFDFGTPTIKKSIPKAEFSLGNNGGYPIYVTISTEKGENVVEIVPDGEVLDERSVKHFFSKVLRNGNKICQGIGFKIESQGAISVGKISLVYKALGGIR